MKLKESELKFTKKIGKKIFENLHKDIIPDWAGLVLSRFDDYINDFPTCIVELYPIINNKDRWKEASNQFNKIRLFGLENENYKYENYLKLAELVAKVTYNASNQSAPFEKDSGYYIPNLAIKVSKYFESKLLLKEVGSVILLFSEEKKLKEDLVAAKDVILYKKIDDILWLDWDPIGINGFAPRDEYTSYVPEIFELVKANADRQEIANRLHKLETVNIRMGGPIENCLIIADKILNSR